MGACNRQDWRLPWSAAGPQVDELALNIRAFPVQGSGSAALLLDAVIGSTATH
jgi:hypothetical protein